VHHRLAALVAATILVAAPAARAQSTASATLESDYWFRGVSLSDGHPAAQAAYGYDAAAGGYVGAFASSVDLAGGAERGVQAIGYGGWALRAGDRASFDAGASYSIFTGDHHYSYVESHVGFALDDLSGSLAYAPNYFDSGARTVYAELNLAHALNDRIRLLAHAGVLWAIGGIDNPAYRPSAPASGHEQVDGRIALAFDVDRVRLQLARTITDGADPVYPIDAYYNRPSRGNWIASISISL
jgi:uncharacterized protein (TIGR02001 family)